MKISSPPYHLRPIEDSDIDWVFRALSDPKVYRYYGVRYLTLEATKSQMEWYESLITEGTGQWFAILDQAGEPLGGIGLNDFEKSNKRAELGYWLLPEYWGKGIMKTVVPAILSLGFDQWDLHRIEAVVEPENEASSALLRSNGFTYEGTRRECEVKNGEFISLEMYSLLAPEYHSE